MKFVFALALVAVCVMLMHARPNVKRAAADVVEKDTGQVKDLSKSEQDEFIAQHRQIRSKVPEGASDMENIKWDADLATKASAWVAKCYFKHPEKQISDEAAYVTPGQDLFRNTHIQTDPPTPTQVVNEWEKELQWYDINDNSCSAPAGKSCGHYVQIVFATVRKVGCAMAYCKEGDGTFDSSGWIAACNYGTGVTTNTAPYQIGSPCTKCSNGKFFCKDKLCADCKASEASDSECTCAANCGSNGVLQQGSCSCQCNVGFAAVDCSEKCEDKDEKCVPKYDGTPYWPDSWCTKDYVKEACPKLCETCTAAPAPAESCENKAGEICIPNTEGRSYYAPEYCQTHPDFMKDNCKKQCGFCT